MSLSQNVLRELSQNAASLESTANDLALSAVWPDPLPLTKQIAAFPYPVDALPFVLSEAIIEVQKHVKAPVPLVAGCALTALSVAGQAFVNVARDQRLQGPCTLYLLSIAASGERKSQCDNYFLQPILEHQDKLKRDMRMEIAEANAALAAWQAEYDGLINAIKKAATAGKDTSETTRKLQALQARKPAPALEPRILLDDETPESLSYHLYRRWPSCGLVSSEAGTVFGGHGMKSESITGYLSKLNILWDGKELNVGRKTSESFCAKDRRLTVGLQIQPEVLRQFVQKTGALARGSGFFARFLLTFPESTKGTRLYEEPAEAMPALERFQLAVTEILQNCLPLDDDNGLQPTMLTLSKEAKEVWIGFHNQVERDLGQDQEYATVSDIASKTADNAIRIAGLFHLLTKGAAGNIAEDDIDSGCALAGWYLHEALRFFGSASPPLFILDACDLEGWLLKQESSVIAQNSVLQLGPRHLRSAARLNPALDRLVEMNRLRKIDSAGRMLLQLNPKLGGGDS